MVSSMKKAISIFFKIISLFPVLWIFTFVLYVLRVSILVGHLPKYDNPQPGDYYYHFTFLNNFLDVVGISFLPYILAFLIINKFLLKYSFDKRFIYIWIVGNVSIILLFFLDPFGLIKWYVD